MKIPKNIALSDCNNDNCLLKMSKFPNGIDCVSDVKKMDFFRPKQDIFFENNSVDGIYFILKGVVKVYKYNSHKDQIVRLATDGDILGHRGIGQSIYPVSAQALTETELCFIEKERFFQLLDESSSLATNLMLFFADELNQEEIKLSEFTNFTVYEKGIKAIKILLDSFGLLSNNFINHSELLSRKELGELVGLTANQMTRTLSEFQDEQLIFIEGKRIGIKNLSVFSEP